MKGSVIIFFIGILGIGCREHAETKSVKDLVSVYKDVFGDEYLAIGSFQSKSKDSIEAKEWVFSHLNEQMVLHGNYSNGLPIGEWRFGDSQSRLTSSTWTPYRNTVLPCQFSLPFVCTDTVFNPYLLKLTYIGDSLGKVSIIVGVSDSLVKDRDLQKYATDAEDGLRAQGYTFTKKSREFKADSTAYIFSEYYMKDAAGKNVKLYCLCGDVPSRKYFVQFTMFHDGPKDEWVKIIYNLMVQSVYIDNERFLNPYLLRAN